MSTPLTAEITESFLALWEKSIELAHPNSRTAMEAERDVTWAPEHQNVKTARRVLSHLAAPADKTTDAGAELAASAKALRATLTSP